MLKYAKITDDTKKTVSVGTGTNAKFYESIGMTKMEVEQAYNGQWYVKGYAPEKPQDEIDAERKAEILARLEAIDAESARPIRAVALGTATDYDKEKIQALEAEAVALREELAGL